MKAALEAEIADETALRERRSEVESELTAAKAREAILDAAIAESAPQVDRAQNTFYALGAQQERLRSTMALAKERVRLGESEEEDVQRGRDPEEIDREAHALRVQESELAGQVDADRLALNAAISERTSAEAALAAEDARLHAATRAVADRREGLARIAGQVAAAKSRLDARSAEIERLDERLAEARERADQAAQEFTALESQVAGMDAGELGLDSEHDESSRALSDAEKELELRLKDLELPVSKKKKKYDVIKYNLNAKLLDEYNKSIKKKLKGIGENPYNLLIKLYKKYISKNI
jgi:chromosome segregation protein